MKKESSFFLNIFLYMNLLKDKYIRVTRVIYDKIFEYIILYIMQ